LKRQRVNSAGDRGGRASGCQDEAALFDEGGLLAAMARWWLDTAQRIRELEGVVSSCWMLDIACPTAMDANITCSEVIK
jgi:hypothetical protein